MTSPLVGSKAPAFSLLNQNGKLISSGDFKGKFLVLYFYPKALTPGCTTQACGLRDSLSELADFNAVPLGISPDPVTRLKKFVEKEHLNFDLLSDEDHKVASLYGVWGLKKFMGREHMGVLRTTFIVDPKHQISAVLDKFTTRAHHLDVLSWFQHHQKT